MEIDKYTHVELSNYNGKYSIVLGYLSKDGKFNPKWCEQEFGKGNKKSVPVKVLIGEKDKAVEVLLSFINEITGMDYEPAETPF
jgi:hypothetical protein